MTHEHTVTTVGSLILNHVLLIDVLASGSYATAYLAEQIDVGRRVVVKVAHPHLMHNAKIGEMIRMRFQQELKVMAKINHPNLVTLYAAGDTPDGLPALVMEYVEGRSLADVLSHSAPMAWPLCQALFQQLIGALASLHAAGVVHRDVTPHNMIVAATHDNRPHLKLLDFGIAQLDNLSSGTLGPIGTPRYLAPEQVQGRASPASDMFSVGALLWWATTGQEFMADIASANDYIVQILAMSSPPDPRTINPQLSPHVASLISRLLHPNPVERPTPTQLQAIWPDLAGYQAFPRPLTPSRTLIPAPAPTPAPAPPAQRPNLLIIDPSQSATSFIQTTLARYKCDLSNAASVFEAADIINQSSQLFDVIFFSLHGLDFSGPDVLQWLRNSLGDLSQGGPGLVLISDAPQPPEDVDPDALLQPHLGASAVHEIVSYLIERKDKRLEVVVRQTNPVMPVVARNTRPSLPAVPSQTLSPGLASFASPAGSSSGGAFASFASPASSSSFASSVSPAASYAGASFASPALRPTAAARQEFIGKLPDLLVDLSEHALDANKRIQICNYIEYLARSVGLPSLIERAQAIANLPPHTPALRMDAYVEDLEQEYMRVFRSIL